MDPILLVLLLFAVLRLVDGDAGSASTVRSWDCCKPSCSWKGAADVSAPVAACDGTNQILKNFDEDSSCGGGKAYLCANQQPWQIDARTSYGFAAVQLQGQDRSAWCCACYHLTFTSGHAQNQSMVVQAISMSPGNPDNIFNLFVSFP